MKGGESMIQNDEKFERLISLSEQAMHDAQKCFDCGVCIGVDEYVLRLNNLLQCMAGIEPHNFEAAKGILLNGILDLNFAFGKTYFDSNSLEDIAPKKRS